LGLSARLEAVPFPFPRGAKEKARLRGRAFVSYSYFQSSKLEGVIVPRFRNLFLESNQGFEGN
jgi:hypothetical protein